MLRGLCQRLLWPNLPLPAESARPSRQAASLTLESLEDRLVLSLSSPILLNLPKPGSMSTQKGLGTGGSSHESSVSASAGATIQTLATELAIIPAAQNGLPAPITLQFDAATGTSLDMTLTVPKTVADLVNVEATVTWEDGRKSLAAVTQSESGGRKLFAAHPLPAGPRLQDQVLVTLSVSPIGQSPQTGGTSGGGTGLTGSAAPSPLDTSNFGIIGSLNGFFGMPVVVPVLAFGQNPSATGPHETQKSPQHSPDPVSVVIRLGPLSSASGQAEWTGTGPHDLPTAKVLPSREIAVVETTSNAHTSVGRTESSGANEAAHDQQASRQNSAIISNLLGQAVSIADSDSTILRALSLSFPRTSEEIALLSELKGLSANAAVPHNASGSLAVEQETAQAEAYVETLFPSAISGRAELKSKEVQQSQEKAHRARGMAAHVLPWIFGTGTGLLMLQTWVRIKKRAGDAGTSPA